MPMPIETWPDSCWLPAIRMLRIIKCTVMVIIGLCCLASALLLGSYLLQYINDDAGSRAGRQWGHTLIIDIPPSADG